MTLPDFGQERKELDEVLARVERAKKNVTDWRGNIARWRDLYNMNHYKERRALENEVLYNDPTHTNTVDLSVGIMLANNLRWHSYGLNPSSQEQKDTGAIEKLIEGTLNINSEREEKVLSYELFTDFNRDAGGVIYSVFDPDIAEASKTKIQKPDPQSESGVVEQYMFNEIPIRMQIIDPTKFICLPGGPKRWLMAGRSEQMSILDLELTYDVQISQFSGYTQEQKATQKGEFIDVWDYVTVNMATDTGEILGKKLAVRNTVLFDKKPVRGPQIMEGYDELPYTVQFFKPIGDESGDWHNIMTPLESSVSLLERTINRRAHQIDVYTGLPIVSKTQPGRVVQVDSGLFQHVQLGTDESIEFPVWPGNSPDVQLHIDFLRTRANQSGFSEVMFGQGSGEAAGYAMSQATDMNRIRLEQPITHLELLLTTWAKKTLKLLEYFAQGTSICVYGQHKGQDYRDYIDIDGLKGYTIRAEIRPNFPAEKSRKVAMASQIKGILSNYSIMEQYLDIEQPEDEEQRKLIESATFHPITMQYALIAEMKTRADTGDPIAQLTLQSLMQGLQGQPGRPAEGPNPAQPDGMPSSTGQPTPQETGLPPAGQSATDQQQNLAQAPKLTGAG